MISESKFSKQAELDFMHNFRHDTEGDRWAKHEIESLRQQLAATQDDFDALKEENESLLKNLRGKHSVTGATYAHLIAERNQLRQQLEQAHVDIAGLHDQLEEPQIAQDDYRLNKLELEQLRRELDAAISEPSIDSKEYKTWWELALHVGAWKDSDSGYVHFGREAAVRAYAILLLRQRDEYEQEQFNTIESLRQQLTDSQNQVTLLREKFQELADNFVWNGDDHSYQHWVIEVSQAALAATEPKP